MCASISKVLNDGCNGRLRINTHLSELRHGFAGINFSKRCEYNYVIAFYIKVYFHFMWLRCTNFIRCIVISAKFSCQCFGMTKIRKPRAFRKKPNYIRKLKRGCTRIFGGNKHIKHIVLLIFWHSFFECY